MSSWTPSGRPLSRRSVLAAVSVAAAISLTGCGVTDAVVGIHPAPAESASGAPLTIESAQTISARVLDAVAAAESKSGAEGEKARKEVMSGSALATSLAAAKTGSAQDTSDAPLQQPGAPQVLALSKGQQWPRAMLVTTLDKEKNLQFLQVLTSASAAQPFVLTARVPMLSGASLPGIGEVAQGAEFVDANDGKGLVLSPQDALAAYAKALDFPKPTGNDKVSTSDAYSTALKASAEKLKKDTDKLANVEEKHAPVAEETLAFRLSNGGVVTFGRANRTDKIQVTDKAESLTIPAPYDKLVGKKSAKKHLTVQSIENFVMVVPATGKATVIGAAEQVAGGSAE